MTHLAARLLKRHVGKALGFAIFLLVTLHGSGQTIGLRVVSATPTGELGQIADADEVRVVFSEPMIALGTVPSGVAPSWIRISPAVAGSFFWSGTKTLIFSPEVTEPIPFATKFTVHVDASATSVLGHPLGTPFDFTFTTPTVRLLAAEWYRKTTRFDSPAILALRFNQRVRPEDVAAHVTVSLTPHQWTPPTMSSEARDYLRRSDRAGLDRFDEKVAAVQRVTSSREAIGVRVAASWDERRFPRSNDRVVLETTTAPPTDAWLTVTADAQLPSPEGPEKHPAQSSVVRLEPTFFVVRTWCQPQTSCTPTGGYDSISLSRSIVVSGLARALSITDVTDQQRPGAITAARAMASETGTLVTTNPTVQMLGFDSQPPMRTWRFNVDSELEATDGQTLGYPWIGVIQTIHHLPYLSLGGAVWESGAGPQLPVVTRNILAVTQWVTPVDRASVMPRLLALRDRNAPMPPGPADTRPLAQTADALQAHGFDVRRLLSPAGAGVLWTAVSPAGILPDSAPRGFTSTVNSLVQITNLGISVKDSPQSTLVFVSRLDTGAPVGDARVAIVDTTNRVRWSGTTSADGVALAPAMALRQANRTYEFSFLVTAEKDNDFAFVGSDWNGDVQPYNWQLQYQLSEAGSILRGSVFSDRGVYKEAEEVHLKAVLRDDTPGGMQLVENGRSFDVLIRDNRGREASRSTIKVNRWSSAEWTWQVPADAALGYYSVDVTPTVRPAPDGNSSSVRGSFLVAAYRRPDFRVDASLSADPAVLGSTLHGTVEAKYLFGGALGTRPVRWWFNRFVVQNAPADVRNRFPQDRYAIGYLPRPEDRRPQESALPTKTETLPADGRALIDLPTEPASDAAYTYSLEGDVTDVSGQHIANRASLVVHPASLYIALSRPPVFVDTKTGLSVGVAATDLKGQLISGVPVTVSLWREQWTSTRRPENPGSPTWERKEIAAGEWSIRTNGGETTLPIPIRDGGSYVLRATASDAAGRRTRTDVNFWALGSGFSSWRSEGNRIDLTPERKTWKPGETARVLIQSPWERATALVTVEREGIRSHRTITITSTQDTVDIPVTEADVPNVYVSVVLVKGRTSNTIDESDSGRPGFRVGYTELSVDNASKRLKVAVSADRDEYRPRQPVRVSVAATSPDGRPASSEVTLWAVDYGLLSLTNYTTPDVLKAIYAPKALQVMTEDNRQRLISRKLVVDSSVFVAQALNESVMVTGDVSVGLAQGGAGGGRGGGGVFRAGENSFASGMPAPPAPAPPPPPGAEIRDDFRSLVFWLGSTTTGADGKAETTVTLPDSLTTYRIMAVAGDDRSHFGFGEREIHVTKPLTLLPAFPRFLSQGDRATFGAVVTNSSKDAGNAVVSIQSLNPNTLQFATTSSQTVRLAPGASEAVKFDATARGSGGARVRMVVTLGADTDAFEMPLLVTVPMRLETTAAYGDTLGTATERLALPSGLMPGAGGLSVELASTALVGLGEGARYLDEYPYDCAEQKSSRALALLLAADLGGAFKLSGIKPEEYRAAGSRALNELYGYQCGSGGFALWAGYCGNESAYLTAYVLHVMKVADTLQVVLDRNAIDRALNFLQNQLRQPPPELQWFPVWSASQAYAVKVLAEFGRNPNPDVTRLVGMAERMPVFALSYLADALAAMNDRSARYQDVVRRVNNALRIEADRAHAEELDDAVLAWLWNSNVRATGVVLDGLARRKDDPTLVAPLVRWLLAARTNGRWGTTHENAMALEALVSYYRAFESEIPQMTAVVSAGSATIGSINFNGRSTTSQQLRLSMPDLLKQVTSAAAPALTIAKSGTGRLFYTARVQYLAPEPPEAVDRGFRVERSYEKYVPNGSSPAATSFQADDLIRVTVRVTLRGEGRYLALTDPLPAGLEPLEGWFNTTASDLAANATRTSAGNDWLAIWRRGTFDHVEKHDDRVVAFATRLGSGRQEFSYLARATTAGTFTAAGARVEAMYAPELSGRSAAARITIR